MSKQGRKHQYDSSILGLASQGTMLTHKIRIAEEGSEYTEIRKLHKQRVLRETRNVNRLYRAGRI